MKIKSYLFIILFVIALGLHAQESDNWLLKVQRNKPERVEWFKDLGFGMFIHWSHDVQLGSVISHSMVGATEDYLDFFVNELPKSFNPTDFNPEAWADYAKLAGMKYVVFTAKHHSGFCMFHTETTDFSIENTPFKRDATKEILEAFRAKGIAVGLYFSPDDFTYLYNNGLPIDRDSPKSLPGGNPALMDFTKKQLKELLTNYGKIDMIFLDGQTQKHEWINTELAAYCWDLDPDILVTRGGMKTPEQNLPNQPLDGPWEACFTMGTQWQYKPTNESYKSGTKLIEMLIETRAKGGNLLLNVGPDETGRLPVEQNQRLQEIALWRVVNQEAIYGIEPFSITNEDFVWYTKKPGENTVYAFITGMDLPIGKRKQLLLERLSGSSATKISVLGHDGKTLEYNPGADVVPWCKPAKNGLIVSFTRSQRLYNDKKWPNSIVLKLEGVEYRER
ncbi:MAG: alpha-L-fucosidase [Cyclobacteriaceae bacterium]